MTEKERTWWRDWRLLDLHRRWGKNVPVVDFDCITLEYDLKEPVAVIEYKEYHAPAQHASDPSYVAIRKLCDRAGVMFFAVRYNFDRIPWFRVVPLNEKALDMVPARVTLYEDEYMSMLYRARNRVPPEDLVLWIRENPPRFIPEADSLL